MTLDQAIKIGKNYLKGSDEAEPVDFDKFIKLGIEALKRLSAARREGTLFWTTPLPGETKE